MVLFPIKRHAQTSKARSDAVIIAQDTARIGKMLLKSLNKSARPDDPEAAETYSEGSLQQPASHGRDRKSTHFDG